MLKNMVYRKKGGGDLYRKLNKNIQARGKNQSTNKGTITMRHLSRMKAYYDWQVPTL
jgi:hypothetical protein